MNQDKLKEILDRIPISLLLGCYLGYLGFDYYQFVNDSGSDLNTKIRAVEEIKKENVGLQAKLKEGQEFYKTLDRKRQEIRSMTAQLDDMKATLSEQLDISSFVKTVVTEASKTGLTVQAIKPADAAKGEFYIEQPFDLTFKGVYVQVLVFLERLSNLERIIRVDSFEFKRHGSSLAPYVELEGTIQIKTYKYLGSKADELAKAGGSQTSGGEGSGGESGSGSGTPKPAGSSGGG